MIYFIRHGQTEFNAARRFQGGLDSPLTSLGIAQARAMGRALRDLVDPETVALFVSPLGRARQTAALIADEAGITTPPIVEPGIAEVSLGSWDGKTADEIDAESDGAWSRVASGPGWHFETPDGERYDPFAARIGEALERVRAHPAAARIMISHGIVSVVLRGLLMGLSREQRAALKVPQGVIYRLDPGAITEIDCSAEII